LTSNESVEGDLTVFAASSLTDAFNDIKVKFEEIHPGVDVQYNFAGTSTLRTQLEQGARADIFASANEAHMDAAMQSELIDGTPITFASNRLVVITPSGSERVKSISDLANENVKLVLALPDVPVGAYTRESISRLDASGDFGYGFGDRVMSNLVSEESNVRQVAAKVMLDEADAGIVYNTDVAGEAAARLITIQIPDEFNVLASYPLARLRSSQNPAAARAFVEFVLSENGQAILTSYGFGSLP
jgi:molybdate transport system substrate-binding protein